MGRRIRCKTSDHQDFRFCNWRKSFGCWYFLGAQLIEQRLRFFKISSLEAFGEPVVYLGEHRAGFVAATLVHQQSREAHRCAELEKPGALAASNLYRDA